MIGPALVVRAKESDRYEWVRVLRDGAVSGAAEFGDGSAVAHAAAGSAVFVLVAGQTVRLTTASIPARSQRQAVLAAPFAIEDDIAEDVEDLHIVCGPDLGGGHRAIALTQRATLDGVLAPLVTAGCRITGVQPDFLAVPFQPQHWTLLASGAQVMVRTGQLQGFTIEADAFDLIGAKLRADAPPLGIHCFGQIPTSPRLAGIPQHLRDFDGNALALLAANIDPKLALDLLPNELRTRQRTRVLGVWSAAAVLMAAVLVHSGFMLRANRALEQSLVTVRTAQLSLIAQAFPELTRVVNPLVQANQVVASLKASARPQTAMLEALYIVGRALPRAGSALSFAGINYADGVLNLRVRASDIATLNAYSEALKPDARADVISVDTRDDGVDGNLRVQALAGGAP